MKEFDITNIKTCLVANGVKEGTSGVFSDSIQNLKDIVEHGMTTSSEGTIGCVSRIEGTSYCDRFVDASNYRWNLFYPMEISKPSLKEHLQALADKHKLDLMFNHTAKISYIVYAMPDTIGGAFANMTDVFNIDYSKYTIDVDYKDKVYYKE